VLVCYDPGPFSRYRDKLQAERFGFHSWQRQEFYHFCIAFRLASETTKPSSYPMGTAGSFSPRVKRPRHEAGHSPLRTAEVKNDKSLLPHIRFHDVVLD
jgi:hypothetical protein